MIPYDTKPRKIVKTLSIFTGESRNNKAPAYISASSSMASSFYKQPVGVQKRHQLSHIDEIKESYLSMASKK